MKRHRWVNSVGALTLAVLLGGSCALVSPASALRSDEAVAGPAIGLTATSVPPVTGLTAEMIPREEGGPGVYLSMALPEWSAGDTAKVQVLLSPTRSFAAPPAEALQPGEFSVVFDLPEGEEWLDRSYLDPGLSPGTPYKVSGFFGVARSGSPSGAAEWSPAATTTAAVPYEALPSPSRLTKRSVFLSGYADGAWLVRLEPGYVLDVFFAESGATALLYPPGTTAKYGDVAHQQKRTLSGEQGYGLVYQVPQGGRAGDYVLYATSGEHGFTRVYWRVSQGTGRLSIAVPSRKALHHPQTRAPLGYLCKGSISPAEVGAWCRVRVDVYATYGGKTQWWLGRDDYWDADAQGHFKAYVWPVKHFPGDPAKAFKWRGKFKYRFFVESYAGYTAAYSPVYNGVWSGPQG